MGCDHVCLEKKKGRFWIEAGAGNLPSGSNKVKCRDGGAGCWWTVVVGC